MSFFIGDTPIIKIFYKYKGETKYLYSKLEFYNLTGSIKDRVALYMIKKAEERGDLKPGMPIIEATSGNTGIALSALGNVFRHKVYIFMPDWVSRERVAIMKNFGAKIILVSKEYGGFKRCLEEAKKLSEAIGGYWTNQFSNKDNYLAHYEMTGREIVEEVHENIGGFVSGVGTGGTIMGIGDRIKEKYPEAKICAIEPENMPIISQGKILSQHKIEGIGDEFVPELLDKSKIDEIFLINDDDAINMSKKLSEGLGLGVGISSGANFLGSVLLGQSILEPVTTVFPDDNKKYLSTDLANFDASKITDKFVSKNIELLKYEVLDKENRYIN